MKSIRERLEEMVQFAVDGLFLSVLLLTNWVVERVFEFVEPSGIDLVFARKSCSGSAH